MQSSPARETQTLFSTIWTLLENIITVGGDATTGDDSKSLGKQMLYTDLYHEWQVQSKNNNYSMADLFRVVRAGRHKFKEVTRCSNDSINLCIELVVVADNHVITEEQEHDYKSTTHLLRPLGEKTQIQQEIQDNVEQKEAKGSKRSRSRSRSVSKFRSKSRSCLPSLAKRRRRRSRRGGRNSRKKNDKTDNLIWIAVADIIRTNYSREGYEISTDQLYNQWQNRCGNRFNYVTYGQLLSTIERGHDRFILWKDMGMVGLKQRLHNGEDWQTIMGVVTNILSATKGEAMSLLELVRSYKAITFGSLITRGLPYLLVILRASFVFNVVKLPGSLPLSRKYLVSLR